MTCVYQPAGYCSYNYIQYIIHTVHVLYMPCITLYVYCITLYVYCITLYVYMTQDTVCNVHLYVIKAMMHCIGIC